MSKFSSSPHKLPLIAAIQLSSCDSVQSNLDATRRYLLKAKKEGAICVVLPETFAWMGDENEALATAEPEGTGPVQQFLSDIAKELEIWLIGGSHRLVVPSDDNYRVSNTSLVFDPKGHRIARYDKIHLFDADVNDGALYKESDTFKAGENLCVIDLPFAKLGLSICYDLRFPALYQKLRTLGADIVVVPAAFTVPTGEAHWHALLKSRAIENQVYIIAPAQCGAHSHGRKTWGHSVCIDPWGETVSELGHTPGVIYCPFDAKKVHEIRRKMPVLAHQKAAETAYS